MKKILSYLLGLVFTALLGFWWLWLNYVNAAWECNWIKLNTNFPIIWNCIKTNGDGTNTTTAFPTMIWALTKIVITLILVVCFILVIVAWIKRSSDDPKTAKSILTKVAVTILLLWFSGVVLRLINPNFFG